MHFGFSYIGLLFLIMLTAPNLLWTKNKPRDYDKYAANEKKVLLAMERIGEAAVSCLALIFFRFQRTGCQHMGNMAFSGLRPHDSI